MRKSWKKGFLILRRRKDTLLTMENNCIKYAISQQRERAVVVHLPYFEFPANIFPRV